MAILATNTSTPREPIPAGNYVARCYQMIQIGTIMELINGEQKMLNKVRIGWELPTELKVFKEENGEQPYVISEEYTLSMNEKSNLRKMLASWRGKDFTDEEAKAFDITKLIGAKCMINVIHKASKKDPSRVYEKIGSVSSVPKGLDVPPAINQVSILEYDNFNFDLYNSLPDFIKDKIKGSIEFAAMQQPNAIHMKQQPAMVGDDDDLPF
jgi:hypothetical protein